MKRLALIALLPFVAAGVACGRSEAPAPPPTVAAAPPTTTLPPALSVQAATLGKEIGADKKVATPLESFGAKDTIYASVDTTGVGKGKLRALWTYVRGEKTAKVDETSIDVDASGPAVHEFHVSKPSGWPKGDYKVEIFLNDATAPAVTKTFKVA
jgi:hypothetical protein